jgi:hypothetical protein
LRPTSGPCGSSEPKEGEKLRMHQVDRLHILTLERQNSCNSQRSSQRSSQRRPPLPVPQGDGRPDKRLRNRQKSVSRQGPS